MTIKSPVLTTTTSLTTTAHSFIGTASTPFGRGIAVGINTRTQEVEYFNPWAMKEAGILDSMFGLFLGLIKQGKSMTIKVIAIRLMMLLAGFQTMRTVINDYKPESKEGEDDTSGGSEYGRFSHITGSIVHRVAEMQINPLEERMFASKGEKAYELGVISMAKVIIEFGKGDKLVGHEDTSLRIAVYTMLKHNSALWGLGLLAKLLRSISDEQIIEYYASLDTKLQTQLEQRITLLYDSGSKGDDNIIERAALKQEATGQLSQLVNAKDNTNPADIMSAGDRTASYLESILHGSFGKMLGDKHSLYDIATQRVHTKDWRGVNPHDETLMRIIDTSFLTSAIETHQLDLLPHLKVDDEQHKPMENPVYATGQAFFGEVARGLHMCNLSASHRLDSLRKGDVGSDQYNKANTIINNMGFFWIGRQNNDAKQLKELQDRCGFSNTERDNLPHLPKHVFAVKYGEAEPIRYIQVVATPMEIEMGKTEGAVERMMKRPDINNPDDLVRFAHENKLQLAGT